VAISTQMPAVNGYSALSSVPVRARSRRSDASSSSQLGCISDPAIIRWFRPPSASSRLAFVRAIVTPAAETDTRYPGGRLLSRSSEGRVVEDAEGIGRHCILRLHGGAAVLLLDGTSATP